MAANLFQLWNDCFVRQVPQCESNIISSTLDQALSGKQETGWFDNVTNNRRIEREKAIIDRMSREPNSTFRPYEGPEPGRCRGQDNGPVNFLLAQYMEKIGAKKQKQTEEDLNETTQTVDEAFLGTDMMDHEGGGSGRDLEDDEPDDPDIPEFDDEAERDALMQLQMADESDQDMSGMEPPGEEDLVEDPMDVDGDDDPDEEGDDGADTSGSYEPDDEQIEEENHDGPVLEESDRPVKRKAPMHYVSGKRYRHMRDMLLSVRPLINEGIQNAKRNLLSSPWALKEDERIEGLERDEPIGEAKALRLDPHQRDAIGRGEHLLKDHGAVMFADDMGLGKSLSTIGLIVRALERAKREGRKAFFGVTMPKALLSNWKNELAFAPSLRVCDISLSRFKNQSVDQIRRQFDVLLVTTGKIRAAYSNVLTTYSHWQAIKEGLDEEVVKRLGKLGRKTQMGLQRERPVTNVLAFEYELFAIDEAHHIKNPTTLVARAVRSISCKGRVALTGTPLQNGVFDFGALLMYLRFTPFQNPKLFVACFVSKHTSGVKGPTKRRNRENDAIVGALRSMIAIRRLKDQSFDGKPILDIPHWHETLCLVELSPPIVDYQQKTRHIWDARYQRELEDKALDGDAAYQENVELEDEDEDAVFVKILYARLNIIHEQLIHAKYGDLGVQDVEKLLPGDTSKYEIDARSFLARDQNDAETLARANEQRDRYAKELSTQEHQRLTARRRAFLEEFEKPGNETMWRSDRIYAIVEHVDGLIKKVRAEASAIPDPVQRNEYLGTHKVLIFCEFLSALDVLAIGLRTDPVFGGHKLLRYDGSMPHDERDKNRRLFEESGKDWEKGAKPDDHMIMLITNKAGYEGINLVHATEVCIVAPVWNPSIEDQLTCRAARKGQKATVTVHRFYSSNSIERRMRMVQDNKREQVMKIMDDKFLLKHEKKLVNSSPDVFLEIIGQERVRRAMERGDI